MSCIVEATRSSASGSLLTSSKKQKASSAATQKDRHDSATITPRKSPSHVPPPNPSAFLRHSTDSQQGLCEEDVELSSTVADLSKTKMTTGDSQPDGDTQPVSQRVFHEFAIKNKLESAKETTLEVCDGTCDLDETSLCSYHQGQTGYVDLVGALEQPFRTDPEEPPSTNNNDDMDPLSPAADVRAEIYPESKRFQQPKTPATGGKKLDFSSEITPRGDSTPRLPLNPFAGQLLELDAMMNSSQAFKATQAVSSPFSNIIQSDGLSQRPSPDMYNVRRPITASSMSSPPRINGPPVIRAVTEPQTIYISMKESQAERDRIARQSAPLADVSVVVSSDEDFESDDSQLRRRRNQRKIDLRARGQFVGITAPTRPTSSGRGRGRIPRQREGRASKHYAGKAASETAITSDDLPVEGNVTEDETEHEEDCEDSHAEESDELAEDNKENVEVPMTISRHNQRKSAITGSQSSPSRSANLNGISSSPHYPKPPRSQRQSMNVTKNLPNSEGTQTSGIADSQPTKWSDKVRQGPEPVTKRLVLSASSEVLIPGSQAFPASATSQHPAEVHKGKLLADDSAIGPDSRQLSHPASTLSPIDRVSPPTSGQLTSSQPIVAGFTGDVSPHQSRPQHLAMKCNGQMAANVGENRRILEGASQGMESSTKEILRSGSAHDELELQVKANFEKFLVGSSPGNLSSSLLSTIPETSSAIKNFGRHSTATESTAIIQLPHTGTKSTSKTQPGLMNPPSSLGSSLFETARTNFLKSPSKSHSARSRDPSFQSGPSLSFNPVLPKTLTQIAADTSPRDAIGEVDVGISLLTNEDIEFQDVIDGSSPARKRRRGNSGQVVVSAESKPGTLPLRAVGPSAVNADENQDALATDELAVDYPALEKTDKNIGVALTPKRLESRSRISTAPKPKSASRGRPRKPRPLVKGDTKQNMKRNKGKATLDVTSATKSPHIEKHLILGGISESCITDQALVAPYRVFAHFNGNDPGYFPATCHAVVCGPVLRYRIEFDDGQKDDVDAFAIKRLELRIGDNIKIDTGNQRKKNTYTIQGFSDPQPIIGQPDLETPSRRRGVKGQNLPLAFTDVYGHTAVTVVLKQTQSGEGDPAEVMSIPIKDVYLNKTLWASFKDRAFNVGITEPSKRPQTPSERPSTPPTPFSHGFQKSMSSLVNSRSTKSTTGSSVHLFTNTAFAITNIACAETRERATRQILANGGRIVADGFDELFDFPALEFTSPSKEKCSPKKPVDVAFRLTVAAKRIGFTCLIADKHCRKAKYIQALALGIPCLATRWVNDCISNQRVLPWEPYLLPAGESAFLGGAIHSRVLPPYDPNTATLTHVMNCRPKPLDGASVLLIMSKSEEDTMKFHPLITHGLGASRVSRTLSLEAAAKAIAKAQANGDEKPWDWIYSHDNEKKAEKVLFGGNPVGRKRKRGKGEGDQGRPRVVGNEFVIQSLILGQLID